MTRPQYSTQASRAYPEGTPPPASIVEGQVQVVAAPPLPPEPVGKQVPLWLTITLALTCGVLGLVLGIAIGVFAIKK